MNKKDDKSALIYIFSFIIILTIALGIIFSIDAKQTSSTQPTIQTKTIDEYIIINVRLEHSADGSDFFMFDYAKNGEPMTVYLPSPESVETFTNRLELLGHVIWLCDEPTE